MLSSIVLQANETFYKPTPKGTRKADRMVDYYVFGVGIIREQLILREPSEPEPLVITDDEHTNSDYFEALPSPPGNRFSSRDESPNLPGHADSNEQEL